MKLKLNGMPGKLALGAVVACGVCVVPLAVPVVAAIVGGGALAAGQWVFGGIIALAAVGLSVWKWRKRAGRSSRANECCGKQA